MAKQGKTLPVRRPPERFDDSALLRSAETLGRMIGALQRQLDRAARRLSRSTGTNGRKVPPAAGTPHEESNGHGARTVKTRTPKATARRTAGAGKPKAAASRPVKARTAKASAKRSSSRRP
jgi:hypothetical protein